MFCPKAFLPTPLLPSFIIFLALVHLPLLKHLKGLWETLGPMLFGLHASFFSMPMSYSPHRSWGDQPHFHKIHCTSSLSKELGIYCTYIIVRFLSYHCSFSLETIGINNFNTPPF
jgi:hypothetical protein